MYESEPPFNSLPPRHKKNFVKPDTYAGVLHPNDIVTCRKCYAMVINIDVALDNHRDYHLKYDNLANVII